MNISLLFRIFLLLLVIEYHKTSSTRIFITPHHTCIVPNACTGEIAKPYDNFLFALQIATSLASPEIIFLASDIADHYVLASEQGQSILSTNETIFSFSRLEIRPFFCDEVENLVLPANTKCIGRDEIITVFLKTLRITISVKDLLIAQNIAFDGIEALSDYMFRDDLNLSSCTQERKRCCFDKDGSSNNFEVIACNPGFSNDENENINLNSIFLLENIKSAEQINQQMIFERITLKNFWGTSIGSFVQTYSGLPFNLTFSNCTFDDLYFEKGLVFHSDSQSAVSEINIRNSIFSNYNYWDRYYIMNFFAKKKEAYFLFVETLFRGTINIQRSIFKEVKSATKLFCTFFEDGPYLKDYFESNPSSRSNLKDLCDDLRDSDAISSLISIHNMEGSMIIQDSIFNKISGYEGSVIRVFGSDSVFPMRFSFINSTFDSNIAVGRFANILIMHKSEDPSYCPAVEIKNSSFLNSAGCPGSYGNVGILCQWSENGYVSDTSGSLLESYKFKNLPPLVTISDCAFEKNLLALSNSIAVVGSYSTLLERNLFEGNGGTTGPLCTYNLDRLNFGVDLNSFEYFGQSTAAYFSFVFKLTSRGNVFKANWGPWEGSQALGVSLTILDWFHFYVNGSSTPIQFLQNPLEFENDTFLDHNGVPLAIGTESTIKLNCYTPPLITISNNRKLNSVYNNDFQSFAEFYGESIKLNRVKFINNTVSYNLTDNCPSPFTESNNIRGLLKNNMRYRSGFLKFLVPSEAADIGASNLLDKTTSAFEIGLSFINGEIRDNKLLTEGCLFPTLRIKSYLLDNLLIKDNKINPEKEYLAEDSLFNEPDLNSVANSRNSIFCGFQRNAISPSRNSHIIGNNLRVENNVGVIFDLHPNEQIFLSLANSIFFNNTCQYASSIISLKGSNSLTLNNIFIKNNNTFGITFVSSQDALHLSIFTTYLQNDGKHASLVYLDNMGKLMQISSRVHWNNISPTYQYFADNATPQGALYMSFSSWLCIQNSEFKQNNANMGILASVESFTQLDSVNISNHLVYGTSLIGSFLYNSSIMITHSKVFNNSLIQKQTSQIQTGMIILAFSKLQVFDLEVSEVPSSNTGHFLVGNNIEGSMMDLRLRNFVAQEGIALINLITSDLSIQNFQGNNITSLFKLSKTKLNLGSVFIQTLKSNLDSLYLVEMFNSDLRICQFNYIGTSDTGNYFSLIRGYGNSVIISEAHFFNALYGENELFNLEETSLFSVIDSIFEYTKPDNSPTIFVLSSSKKVFIEGCVFTYSGKLIQAKNTEGSLYFLSNTIIASPYVENININFINFSYFLENQFVVQKDETKDPSLQSQIQITDSFGTIKLQNNIFCSLIGYNGIIYIQALSKPYALNASWNIFINNVGTFGGALHLETALSSQTSNLPQAVVDSSIFLLNDAKKSDSSPGTGGAIYLSSSNKIKQQTIINNTLFVNNSAELRGGAIFFDFMPPDVDQNSRFINNYAGQPNHIGSFPVKLTYYKGKPSSQPPALPNQPIKRPSSSPELYRWEDVASGLVNNETRIFALMDMYDQIVYDDNTSELDIIPEGLNEESKYRFSSKLSIVAEAGLFIIENSKFTYKIHESINVTFKSKAIQPSIVTPIEPILVPLDSSVVEFGFRGCGRGESVLEQDGTTSCIECQYGFWQTSPSQDVTVCEPCDSSSTYCLGADRVGPKAGYWRLNETANIVTLCPTPASCLGSEDDIKDNSSYIDPRGRCAYAYTGNLCSKCIPGWAKTENGECTNCKTNVWYYIRAILVLLFQFLMIILAIQGTFNLSKDIQENRSLKLNGSILIRILTNYFQFISLVGSLPVTWPGVIQSISTMSRQVSSLNENVFTLDCMFSSDHVMGIRIVYFKLLISILGPFILIFFGMMFHVIHYLIKKRQILRNSKLTRQMIATATVICFTMQPSAIQTTFSLFKCDNLYRKDHQEYYFSKDYDVKCWEGSHLFWTLGVGIPSLIIWAIILPFAVYFTLKRNKSQLYGKEIAQKYSFLYGGYRDEKYFWEFIIMGRKFVLISIIISTSFYSEGLEIYTSVLLIMFCYLIHVLANPYVETKLNRLERFNLISAGVINFCGLYFVLVPSLLVLDVIVIICGLSGNLLFLLYFGRLYFAVQIEKLKQNKKIVQIITQITHKFECLKNTKLLKIIENKTILSDKITYDQALSQEVEMLKSQDIDLLKSQEIKIHKSHEFDLMKPRKIDLIKSQEKFLEKDKETKQYEKKEDETPKSELAMGDNHKIVLSISNIESPSDLEKDNQIENNDNDICNNEFIVNSSPEAKFLLRLRSNKMEEYRKRKDLKK